MKITTEIFIKRAIEKHGNKYLYNLVNYKNGKTKVKIICPIHGEFEQTPEDHYYGSGCPNCAGNKKLTTEEFINKAKKIHGNKYSYNLVEYKNNRTKIKIICPIHGIFEQTPYNHLQGSGCHKCSGNYKPTTEEFIKEARKIHGDKYSYKLVEYINNRTKIKILCLKHGIFEQTPNNFISKKQGCPKCSGNIKKTTEEFIKEAKEIHGNKYSYKLVEYINGKTKVKIICPIHGIFEQFPYNHSSGHGCPKCSPNANKNTKYFINKAIEIHENKYSYDLVEYINNRTKIKILCLKHGIFEQKPNDHLSGYGCPKCAGNIKKTTEEFIKEAKEIHGNKYSYDLVDYINNKTKIKILCSIHGIFEQIPYNHLQGNGCSKCSGSIKKTTKEFIKEAKEIHGNKYNYSLVKYENTDKKIKIICLKHGIFEQTPYIHLKGHGCPNCKNSIGEIQIRNYLIENNIEFKSQKTFKNCKYKQVLHFDFYLPKLNICIEYDGIQHFKPIEYFGGKKALKENKIRDKIKDKYCKENDIKLIRIKYNENIISFLNTFL